MWSVDRRLARGNFRFPIIWKAQARRSRYRIVPSTPFTPSVGPATGNSSCRSWRRPSNEACLSTGNWVKWRENESEAEKCNFRQLFRGNIFLEGCTGGIGSGENVIPTRLGIGTILFFFLLQFQTLSRELIVGAKPFKFKRLSVLLESFLLNCKKLLF